MQMSAPRVGRCTLLLLSTLAALLHCGLGLRVTAVEVPRVVTAGSDVRLSCAYELSRTRPDPLYSIKWYRGHEQFYELLPSRAQPTKRYSFPGIAVDVSTCRSTNLLLYHTNSMQANMTVVEVPSWGPVVVGVRDNEEVAVGHILGLSCSIALTEPPATLSWLINGQSAASHRVPAPVVQTYKHMHRPEIRSDVRLYLSESMFQRGALRLTCRAVLEDVFLREARLTLHDAHKPKPAVFGWFSSGCEAQSSLLTTCSCAAALLLLTL
ncbi:uncharacterized protein LOC125179318 [Hyalella azteca]|uniref:Uncharacterized protein LOC125179318 n=1 Tax=Hyalella azteca TaxID=294128 RepID=A0A979FUJ9_HYAAZ|nr:uncharacterized protein LOC125179318 [Hyalella azteca]